MPRTNAPPPRDMDSFCHLCCDTGVRSNGFACDCAAASRDVASQYEPPCHIVWPADGCAYWVEGNKAAHALCCAPLDADTNQVRWEAHTIVEHFEPRHKAIEAFLLAAITVPSDQLALNLITA